MLETLQFLAPLSTALFCGAAIYINVAEQPSRMSLDIQNALAHWATSYKRATWMQAPLAIIGLLAGGGVWVLGGGLVWLIAGLLIGAVVPLTLIVIMPTNQRLLRPPLSETEATALLERWGKLHIIRTVLSGIATVLMLSRLVTARTMTELMCCGYNCSGGTRMLNPEKTLEREAMLKRIRELDREIAQHELNLREGEARPPIEEQLWLKLRRLIDAEIAELAGKVRIEIIRQV